MDEKEVLEAQQNMSRLSEEKSAESTRVADLLTAGKRIGCKPVKHSIEGFEFETVAVVSTEDRSKFLNAVTNLDGTDAKSIDTLLDSCAELMSAICIEKELKSKDVWIQFNDVSGNLVTLVRHMLEELVASQADIKTFRKK